LLINSRFDFFPDDTKPVLNFLNKVFQHLDKEFCEVAIINDENEINVCTYDGIIDENSVQCHISVIDITGAQGLN
jgi:hypothetical protein